MSDDLHETTRVVAPGDLDTIAEVLSGGGVVALPTETVYGLAARADDPEAVARIFRVKGRPADNPLIVHCADAEQAFSLARSVPPWAEELGRRHWPGPLSLVFDSAVDWPWVQAGLTTLAVRVPASSELRELIAHVGPLAAPSANRSGRPSPTTAAHCLADLAGRIPLLVDGGACSAGLESTVVDCTGAEPVVLRPGPISEEVVREVLGGADRGGSTPADSTPVSGQPGEPPGIGVSPGTRHPHYQPRATVRIVADTRAVDDSDALVIGPAAHDPGPTCRAEWRGWDSLEILARELYGWLREADHLGVPTVWVEEVEPTGLGRAVMDRLKRAAGGSGSGA